MKRGESQSRYHDSRSRFIIFSSPKTASNSLASSPARLLERVLLDHLAAGDLAAAALDGAGRHRFVAVVALAFLGAAIAGLAQAVQARFENTPSPATIRAAAEPIVAQSRHVRSNPM